MVRDFGLLQYHADVCTLLLSVEARMSSCAVLRILILMCSISRGNAKVSCLPHCSLLYLTALLDGSTQTTTYASPSKWLCELTSVQQYIVPELSPSTEFTLGKSGSIKQVEEYKEAKEAGFETRPVVLGPITYLLIAKPSPELGANSDFQPISLLKKLVPVYVELLKKLKEAGVKSVQIDEPALCMDSTKDLASEFEKTYGELSQVGLDITLATCEL